MEQEHGVTCDRVVELCWRAFAVGEQQRKGGRSNWVAQVELDRCARNARPLSTRKRTDTRKKALVHNQISDTYRKRRGRRLSGRQYPDRFMQDERRQLFRRQQRQRLGSGERINRRRSKIKRALQRTCVARSGNN